MENFPEKEADARLFVYLYLTFIFLFQQDSRLRTCIAFKQLHRISTFENCAKLYTKEILGKNKVERNCSVYFLPYLLIIKAISASEYINTVPILCEENYLSARNMSEVLCIKYIQMGVVFSLKAAKLKKKNLKTYSIRASVYLHAEKAFFFPLKLLSSCAMAWVGLLMPVSLSNIFLRFKLP